MAATTADVSRASTGITRYRWAALAVLALAQLMVVLDTTIGVIVGRYLLQLDGLKDADPKEITDLLRPSFHSLVDHGVEPKKTRAPRSKRRRAG